MRHRVPLTILLLTVLATSACSNIESDEATDERFGRTQTGALEAAEGAHGPDGSGAVDDLADLLAGIPPEERDEVRSEVEALLAELSEGDRAAVLGALRRRDAPPIDELVLVVPEREPLADRCTTDLVDESEEEVHEYGPEDLVRGPATRSNAPFRAVMASVDRGRVQTRNADGAAFALQESYIAAGCASDTAARRAECANHPYTLWAAGDEPR